MSTPNVASVSTTPCSVLWCGGVHISDIIKTQSAQVPSQIVERKTALVDIFQTLSDHQIQEPINRNFHWQWDKNWIIIAFKSTEAAKKVKQAFDTFLTQGEKGAIKKEKEDRVRRLQELFPSNIDWSNFIVDYKTPKFRGPTTVPAHPIKMQPQTFIVEESTSTDVGLPNEARDNIISNPTMHSRSFASKSAAQKASDASKVGHANANNGAGWQLMSGDGSNVNMQHRTSAPVNEQCCCPTVVSLIQTPSHRVAMIKVDLPLTSPCLIGIVPVASGERQPTSEVCKKYTQNIVI
jgi:hypothetical protein